MSDKATAQHVALVIDYALDYLGGAQSAFMDQAHTLAEAGYRVTIIAPATPAAVHNTQTDSPLHAWKGGALLVKPLLTVPVLRMPLLLNRHRLRSKLRTLLLHEKIDIVHVHSEFGLAAAAAAAATSVGVPVVNTVHTFFWQAHLRGVADVCAASVLRLAARWLLQRGGFRMRTLASQRTDAVLREVTLRTALAADAVVSPSAHQAESLRQAGVPQVFTVPNVYRQTQPEAPDEPTQPQPAVSAAVALVWVGRLVPEKRVLEFIAALRIAAKRDPKTVISATIVGDGPLLKAAQTAAAGLPVRFTGRLERGAALQLMRDADATVITSNGFDNQPVVIVESVSQGTPVLLCDRKLVEGLAAGSGLYTQDASPQALADLLLAVAADPVRLTVAAHATQQDRQEFSATTHVSRLAQVYAAAKAR